MAGTSAEGKGGGAVVPLLDEDLSMGLQSDRSAFWLNLTGDKAAVTAGAPASMKLQLTPWNPAMSVARPSTATYAASMGYDILRVHGTRVSGTIDDVEVNGTAYFQKVCVQAPSPPWYWGVLHFEDGSYMDWFLPHLAPTITARTSRPWKKRDIKHIALSQGGLFHDAKHQRTERFARVEVVKEASPLTEASHGEHPGAPLPQFSVHMWNGRTRIKLVVQAVDRAHWHFDQPTRGVYGHTSPTMNTRSSCAGSKLWTNMAKGHARITVGPKETPNMHGEYFTDFKLHGGGRYFIHVVLSACEGLV